MTTRCLPLLLLALVLSLSGCAHQAKHFAAPDHKALTEAGSRLRTAVQDARTAAVAAARGTTAIRQLHAAEVARLERLGPQLDALAKVVPPELLAQVQGIQAEVSDLRSDQAGTEQRLHEQDALQRDLTTVIDRAGLATAEVDKLTPEYYARVEELTARANAAEQAWAKDSAELVKLKTHSWLYRIAAVLGLLAVAALLFLWFTGRLAAAGARLATRL